MRFTIHENADRDLDNLSHIDNEAENAIGYIDKMLDIIASNPYLIEDLFKDERFRDYEPPLGKLLGVEVKKIISLCKQGYQVRRMKFDDDCVKKYRVIFSATSSKNPDGTYENEIQILSVIDRTKDSFDYQDDHVITRRIKKDYAN